MAAKRGRLEAKLTADAIWQVTVSSALGGAVVVTVLASGASAYPTDLATALQTALNTAARGTFVVTPSFGESGTGLVSIAQTNGAANPWSITWGSTNLRRAFGFTANMLGVSSTQTGTQHASGVWIADCVKRTRYGDADPGHTESDKRSTRSPTGAIKTLSGNRITVNDAIEWTMVTQPKARQAAETLYGGPVGQSFEQFHLDCILGELAYCTPGTTLRLYWDADLSTNTEYGIEGMDEFKPEQTVPDWVGLWRIALPRLIKVP